MGVEMPTIFGAVIRTQKTFPDATFVVTHRDPVAVIQSAVTMMTYT